MLGALELFLEGPVGVIADEDAEAIAVPSSAVAPRQILQAQVARADAMGLTLRVASELEFYVFNDSYEQAAAKRYHDLDTIGKYIQDYHILQTTKEEKLLQPLRGYFDALGFDVENSKGEWGPGQEELNLAHQEPVEMADRHCIFKHGVKEFAALQGISVTFMAKWHTNNAGNSFHLHSSLWDRKTGKPLGWDPKGPAHMSTRLRQWVAGQLALGRELECLLCALCQQLPPLSGRVLRADSSGGRSGQSHLRDADPGAFGQRHPGREPLPRCRRQSLSRLCGDDCGRTLRAGKQARDGRSLHRQRLRRSHGARSSQDPVRGHRTAGRSKAARAAFGDTVVDHYVNTALQEQAVYDKRVTDLDLQRNFERA